MTLVFKQLNLAKEKEEYLKSWCEAFERQNDIDRVKWAILCPFNTTFIVKDGLKIVAGYSFLKREINLFPYAALIANNMFVIPSYQGQYLNIKLAKYAFDNLPCEEAILFGAPRKNVVPFHKRAGWTVEKPKSLLTCELERLYQFEELKTTNSEDLTYSLEKNSEVFNNLQILNDEKIRFKPLKSYLKWRFMEHPYCSDRSYKITKTKSNSFIIHSFFKPLRQLNFLLSSFSTLEDEKYLLINMIRQAKLANVSVIRFLDNDDFKSDLYKKIKDFSTDENYYLIIKFIGNKTQKLYCNSIPKSVFDLGDNDSY